MASPRLLNTTAEMERRNDLCTGIVGSHERRAGVKDYRWWQRNIAHTSKKGISAIPMESSESELMMLRGLQRLFSSRPKLFW